MKTISRYIMTLALLLTAVTGAWAETGENIFQYCYDCQRNPAYPKTTASASLSGFATPLVGYKGSGFDSDNTSAGPWKLEYMGLWSTTDKHEVDDVSYYQYTYNCTDVPVFRLYQWNATANEYQHAAYGVVCAYAKVSNAVEHSAMFVSKDGWGCVLTNSSHSSSMNITFDEDLTTGLTTLIAAATPDAPSGPTVEWNASTKTGTFAMPAFDVEIAPIYAPVAQWAEVETVKQLPTAIKGIFAGTTDAIVKAGTVAMMGKTENLQGIVMYAVTSTNQATAPEFSAFSADVPTAKDIADEGADVLVWYYIKGADTPEGQTATAENTFNDSEICAEPIKVTVLSNKYDITFNAANANTIEAGKATVKVGETAAEVKEGKLTGVKMGSKVTVTAKEGYKFRKVEAKKNEKKLTIGDITLDITGCTTWQQVADKNSTLISASNNMIWNASTSKNLKKGDSYVRPDDPVDPTATDYQFVAAHS